MDLTGYAFLAQYRIKPANRIKLGFYRFGCFPTPTFYLLWLPLHAIHLILFCLELIVSTYYYWYTTTSSPVRICCCDDMRNGRNGAPAVGQWSAELNRGALAFSSQHSPQVR